MKSIGFAIVLLAAVTAAHGDEVTVGWYAPGGELALETIITMPGAVTQGHLDAIQFKVNGPSAADASGASSSHQGLQSLRPEISGRLDLPVAPAPSGAVPAEPEPPDWSGATVRIVPRAVTTCALTQGTLDGFVGRQESLFIFVEDAMTIVSALATQKGDPDLYLADIYGTYFCSSRNPGKSPESCAGLELSCQNGDLWVQVFGVKKKNVFSLGIWATMAL